MLAINVSIPNLMIARLVQLHVLTTNMNAHNWLTVTDPTCRNTTRSEKKLQCRPKSLLPSQAQANTRVAAAVAARRYGKRNDVKTFCQKIKLFFIIG